MRYLMLVRVPDDAAPTPEEADPRPWYEEAVRRGQHLMGERLRPADDATTVTAWHGVPTVTHGPFAEVAEQIVGFDLLEVASQEEAVAVAAGHPVARFGALELRALWPHEAHDGAWVPVDAADGPAPDGDVRDGEASYLLLMASVPAAPRPGSEAERAAVDGTMDVWLAETDRRDIDRGGAPLRPAEEAIAVRVRDGRTLVTHGPFAELAEQEWSRVVATLIRLTGDWSLAEDCAQEAFAAAHVRWADDGVPRRPGAWLTTVARNRARDRLRRRAVEQRRVADLAVLTGRLAPDDGPDTPSEDDALPDDRLRLVFTCCHPALPVDTQVALTLRTVCGLTVAEIARAFGTSEAAMAKRLVRTRGTIAHARIPYRVPVADQLAPRLAGALAVVYLVFTEGYAATSGASPVRTDLCVEAIRLGRLLAELLPGESEVHATLALMLLHDARRPARTGPGGALVPLDEQDRDRWDRAAVADGVRALRTAQGLATVDAPSLLQAEIAACHSTASAASLTPWATVVHLYDRLLAVAPSPHARLARTVAVGMADGPEVGLAVLRDLVAAGALDGVASVHAAEADLLRRAGRTGEAIGAYERAVAAAPTDAERRYLLRRLAELSAADRQRP